MKALACILAAVALVLLVFLVEEHGAAVALRLDNAKLRAQLSDSSEKIACAERARAAFRALGYSESGNGSTGLDSDSYSNHYNPGLKRCLMVIVNTSFRGGHQTVTQVILDVDERLDLGDYGWVSSDTAKYWEQPPIQCRMTLPGKPEAICHSTAEWDAYIKSVLG